MVVVVVVVCVVCVVVWCVVCVVWFGVVWCGVLLTTHQLCDQLCDVNSMTMTMRMTHSEKSNICQMKAWPYRQECRVMTPRKNLLCC